jgi:5S rRNA maturation endonuclease (ribonuclease M5)
MKSFDYGYKFALIVEGTNDEYFLRSVFQSPFPTLILHGNGLTKFQKEMIQKFIDSDIIPIIAVDPDEAGQQVADKILEEFDIPRLIFDPEECKCYRGKKIKIGLEHTSPKHVLESVERLIDKLYNEMHLEYYECLHDSERDRTKAERLLNSYRAVIDLKDKSLWKGKL